MPALKPSIWINEADGEFASLGLFFPGEGLRAVQPRSRASKKTTMI